RPASTPQDFSIWIQRQLYSTRDIGLGVATPFSFSEHKSNFQRGQQLCMTLRVACIHRTKQSPLPQLPAERFSTPIRNWNLSLNSWKSLASKSWNNFSAI